MKQSHPARRQGKRGIEREKQNKSFLFTEEISFAHMHQNTLCKKCKLAILMQKRGNSSKTHHVVHFIFTFEMLDRQLAKLNKNKIYFLKLSTIFALFHSLLFLLLQLQIFPSTTICCMLEPLSTVYLHSVAARSPLGSPVHISYNFFRSHKCTFRVRLRSVWIARQCTFDIAS